VSAAPDTRPEVRIVPSVLPADFSRFGEACVDLEKAGVDRLQFDVMDGRFVPNLTFGADIIASLRSWVDVPFEAHLMIEEPDLLAPQFVKAGCELVIIHAEATRHLHRSLGVIRDAGGKAAVAINPGTPVEAVANVLDLVDLVLVMTVNPGFGGQAYLGSMEPKIARMRELIDATGRAIDLEVDGGIGPATIAGASAAGADVFIAGTALFRDPLGLEHAVSDLRARASAARPRGSA
jgi:ribulose-phosphate 3-epimerase